MRRWLERSKARLSQWMRGRYGADELSRFLVPVSLALFALSCFRTLRWCYPAALILMLVSVLRCWSRNTEQRARERAAFLRAVRRVRSKRNVRKQRWADRKSYRYLTCRQCRTVLRVPRGKGKLEITCPRCGERFRKKV